MRNYDDLINELGTLKPKSKYEDIIAALVVGCFLGLILGYAWAFNTPKKCDVCKKEAMYEVLHMRDQIITK